MGRYDFAAQRVHKSVTRLLDAERVQVQPPWYSAVGEFPPTERLTRPALQRPRGPKGDKQKASRMFKPLPLKYPEDRLRATFFGDHPWELARPRTMLENDGTDYRRQEWSFIDPLNPESWHDIRVPVNSTRPFSGESVIQRQRWLMENKDLTEAEAYDDARKEFYRLREAQEIQTRVAKEEALHHGADFGMSAIDVGLELEDREFEKWKEWAKEQVETARQVQGSMYTGTESEDSIVEQEDLEAVETDVVSHEDLLREVAPSRNQKRT